MTDRYADWVTVVPESGRLKETAAELLALAGDPRLVRTGGGGTEFLVPPDVAEKFMTPARVPETPAQTLRDVPKRRSARSKKED